MEGPLVDKQSIVQGPLVSKPSIAQGLVVAEPSIAQGPVVAGPSIDQGDESLVGHGGQRGTAVAEQSVGQGDQLTIDNVDQPAQGPIVAKSSVGQVLQFKYYFRGRDLTSQLWRKTVGILFISISILYEQDHSYFRLRGSVRIFVEERFTSGSRFRDLADEADALGVRDFSTHAEIAMSSHQTTYTKIMIR